MEKQLTLFKEKRKLPQWIMRLFILANAGKYRNKHIFYSQIKKPILKKHGVVCGYDLQRIKIKCRSCGGTGWYYSDAPCFNCHNGIYNIYNVYLLRYNLDNTIFHQPVDIEIAMRHKKVGEFVGYVKHKHIKRIKAQMALFTLLLMYNRNVWFIIYIKGSLKSMYRKTIKTIKTIQWKLKRNKYPVDDLPF